MLKTFKLLITLFLFFVCAGLDSQKPALKSFPTEGENLRQIIPLEKDYRKTYAQKLLQEKPTQTEENTPSTPARAVIPGVDDRITVRNMSVRLPAGTGWTVRLIPISNGGQLYEFERDLLIGNRVQIHIVDYYGPIGATEFERSFSNKNDAQRLDSLIQAFESVPQPQVLRSDWVTTERGPQSIFGAVCRERHDLREERDDGGRSFLWQDRMLFCVDPVSRIPIQIDYAERYPIGGMLSPSFAKDSATFFDSVEFRPVGK